MVAAGLLFGCSEQSLSPAAQSVSGPQPTAPPSAVTSAATLPGPTAKPEADGAVTAAALEGDGAVPSAEADAGSSAAPEPADGAPAHAQQPAPENAAASARPKRRYVVAAMGDSLTDAKSHGGKYLDVLRQHCPKSLFDNYGVGGQMVNQMRRRFAHDILGEHPDPDHPKPKYTHVIVLGGINDICSDETAKRTNRKIKTDLEAMYRAAKAKGIKVIAITMPPWGGFKRYFNPRRDLSTREVNEWIRSKAKDGTVDAVFDVYPLMSCGTPEELCERYSWPDHVHWNADGHKVAGEALYQALFTDCE